MTKMKRYPRFLALLATLALLLNSVPLILQAAADNAAMTLRVLEDFTGLVPGGEVGSLTVDGVNKGTVAAAESPGALGGNALVMRSDAVVGWTGTEGWAGYTMNFAPGTTLAGADALLLYVKGLTVDAVKKVRFALTGTKAGGQTVTVTPKGWTKYDCLSLDSGTWGSLPETDDAQSLRVPGNFHGYIRLPLAKLTNGSGIESLTSLKLNIQDIGGANGTFLLGGIWAVTANASSTSTNVTLDGATESVSLIKADVEGLYLEVLENFQSKAIGSSWSVSDAGKATGSIVPGIGSVGGGNALRISSPEQTGWPYPYVSIPIGVSADAQAESTGLMVYIRNIQHGSRINMYVRVKGTKDGATATAVPFPGTAFKLYNTQQNAWQDSGSTTNNNPLVQLPDEFERYVYLPFSQLQKDGGPAKTAYTLDDITSIEIGAHNVGPAKGPVTIDNLYLVRQPGDFASNAVTLAGDEANPTTLYNPQAVLHLAVLEDYADEQPGADYGQMTVDGAPTGSLEVVRGLGDIASGNALKAGSGETVSGIPYVDVPVNVTAAAKQAASGLMVYIREVNKAGGEAVNLHVRVHGTAGGQDVIARMFSWDTSYKAYDIRQKKWIGLAMNDGSYLCMPSGFEGYVYLPFRKMENADGSNDYKELAMDTITRVQYGLQDIGGANGSAVLGATYLVIYAGFLNTDAATVAGVHTAEHGSLNPSSSTIYDPVLHLDFDDATAQDKSGFGNHGAASDGVTYVEGIKGKAVHIDNTGVSWGGQAAQYVNFGTPDNLRFGEEDFSVSLWYRAGKTKPASGVLISNKDWFDSGISKGFSLVARDSGLNANIADGKTRIDLPGQGQGIASLNDANWHQVVLSVSREGNAVLYLDGQPVSTKAASALEGALDNGLFQLGRDTKGKGGLDKGDVDEIKVWRKALSATEVTAEYKAIMDYQQYKAPVLSVGFDGNLNDDSGNGYDGRAGGDGVEYIEGISGQGLFLYNRTSAGHLWGKPAVNWVDFTGSELNLGGGSFTVSGWYKTNQATPVQGVLFTNKDASGNGFTVQVDTTRGLIANICAGGTTRYVPANGGGTGILDRAWHHVAFTVDRQGEAVLYLDGRAIFSTDVSTLAGDLPGGTFTIGRDNVSGKYGLDDANVDEVQVYRRALSAGEIAALQSDVQIRLKIRSYRENLAKITVDNYFYKQADLDAIIQALDTLEEEMDGKTIAEKQALLNAFDSRYNTFMEGPRPLFSFAAGSDPHLRETGANLDRFNQFLGDVKTALPDAKAVLVSGDMTENGSQAEFDAYWNALKKNTPEGTLVLSALGNHDARGPLSSTASMEQRWANAKKWYLDGLNTYLGTSYTDVYYHREIGGYDFITLNTENADKDMATVSQKQLIWFENQLKAIAAAKPGQPIFVQMHQALKGTHPLTDVETNTVGAASDALKAIIAKYPQVVYFSGHTHNGVGFSDIINDGKGVFIDLPSMEHNGRGNPSLTLAHYVSVYDGFIRLRVRDFASGQWLPEYERIIDMTVAGTVDKDDLRALYQKYMTMGQGRYSDETWAVYEAAFGEAHRVLNDRAATQAQVNDARKALQSAVDGLEVVPVDLAANKPAMDLTMLQDFGSLPAVTATDGDMTATLASGSRALDGKNTLVLGAETAKGSDKSYSVSMPAGRNISQQQGLLLYLKTPKHKDGERESRVGISLRLDTGKTIDWAGAVLSYLDSETQNWVPLTVPSNGLAGLPAGFEGYVKLLFSDLPAGKRGDIAASGALQALEFRCGNVGGDAFGSLRLGAVYGIVQETGGLTARIGGKDARFLVNGRKPDEDQQKLFAAAMKGETLLGFKGFEKGEDARARGLQKLYNVVDPDNITATFVDSPSGLTGGPALQIDAPQVRGFWETPGGILENVYYETYYPANTYIDNMQAFMFYIQTPDAHPAEPDDPFTTKVFFNLHTVNAAGVELWTNTGDWNRVYFLEKGSGEWQPLETDAGHVRLPVNTEGYVLAPLDQFKTNPIVKDMANRRLLDTTFIFSGLGGETGPVVIDNIWSVIDMGENNRLFSYNGADTWYLSENREATIADLEGGGGFEEDKLLDELPAATILDKFIHEPAYEDITAHSITMSWDAHEDAAAYRVEIYQSVGTSAGIKYKLISDKTLDGTSATMGGLDPLTWYFAVVHVLDEEGGITGTYPNLFFQTADVEDNPDNPDDPNNPDNPHNPDRPEPNPNPGTGVAARVLLPVAMLSGSLGLILVSRRRRRS